jgi:mannosyltransferase OCH1-like enzyme
MLFFIILCADIRNILLYFRAKYTLKSYHHHNTKHHLSLQEKHFSINSPFIRSCLNKFVAFFSMIKANFEQVDTSSNMKSFFFNFQATLDMQLHINLVRPE